MTGGSSRHESRIPGIAALALLMFAVLSPAQLRAQDADADGILDASDNCPLLSNSGQLDSDGDGIGNLCDNCPANRNFNQLDNDGDGIGTICDNCPALGNA